MTLADLAEITDHVELMAKLKHHEETYGSFVPLLASIILQARLLETTQHALDDRIKDDIQELREVRAAVKQLEWTVHPHHGC